MQLSSDTLFRQWTMLRAIPVYPSTKSTTQIKQELEQSGFSTTNRTIQRDLDKLSSLFGFTNEEQGRSFLWFWPRETAVPSLPALDPATALIFSLSRQTIFQQFPNVVTDKLAHWFRAADETLTTLEQNKYSGWKNKVATVDVSPNRLEPGTSFNVQHMVYEALWYDQPLKIKYQKRNCSSSIEYKTQPLGIVSFRSSIYLVADYGTGAKNFLVNRILDASLLPKDSVSFLPNFKLDAYLKTNSLFQITPTETISLKIRMTEFVAQSVMERPLSNDQTISAADGSGYVEISATCVLSNELRWWLQGYGDNVEILAPYSLRKEFYLLSKNLLQMYS